MISLRDDLPASTLAPHCDCCNAGEQSPARRGDIVPLGIASQHALAMTYKERGSRR
jgi:hypothetical protein